MSSLRVAIVSRDPEIRLAAAKAFDEAPTTWAVELHESAPAQADVVVWGTDVATGPARNAGVIFDPAEPDRVLAAVAAAADRDPTSAIVVTGAGRGMGSTTVALHLARAIAQARRTCLLDLDPRRGAARRLGLVADETGEVAGPDDGRLRPAIPVPGGFRLIGAASHTSEEVAASFDEASAAFERVVVDVPWGPHLEPALARAGAAVLVVSPTKPAAQLARELLRDVSHPAWAIVTNRLGPGGETTRAALEAIIGRRITLELPCTPSLRDAEDAGVLLSSPWHRWVRAIGRLARAFEAA